MRVTVLWLRFALLALLALGWPSAASAEPTLHDQQPLDDDDARRLLAGETVVRPQTVEIDRQRYVGGLVYVVVKPVSPAAMIGLLTDPDAMREILPRTQFVERVATRAGDALLELHQGNSLLHARYTLRVRNEPEQNRVRFWLDRGRPHAIQDAWGFFRYEPFDGPAGPSMLLTYGILIDLGPGVVRSLYEEKLRAMALTVPLRLREYVGRPRRT